MTTPIEPKRPSRILKYGGGFLALMLGIAAVAFVLSQPWWKTLIAALVIGGAWKAYTDTKQNRHSADQPGAPLMNSSTPTVTPAGTHHWPSDQGSITAVGTHFYQPSLKSLAGDHGKNRVDLDCVAALVPESDNPHDASAVAVLIQDRKVGHLSMEDARSFRRRLGSKKLTGQTTYCNARIWGGFDRNGDPRDYGVDLYIKPFM